jgi:DNA polymerase-3 subunit gamma/tau
MNELHTKYRPKEWSELVGRSAVKAGKSIVEALDKKKGRAFLLSGASGVGKTTIARLIARHIGVDPEGSSYYELDAATRTGVDDMREVTEKARRLPMSENPNRVLCLDEAHMLSKNAWNALLKTVEEPPEGVFWVFCTTEPSKVPAAIRTRCLEYDLKPASSKELGDLLEQVEKNEKAMLDDAVFDAVIEAAGGSPRAMLVAFAKVSTIKNVDDALSVLDTANIEANEGVAQLCRLLGSGNAQWGPCMKLVQSIEGVTAEGVRNVVCAWFSKVAVNAKSFKEAEPALAILEAFSTPYPSVGSSLHPLLLSIGQLMR